MGRRMTDLSDDGFHVPAFFDPVVESGDWPTDQDLRFSMATGSISPAGLKPKTRP